MVQLHTVAPPPLYLFVYMRGVARKVLACVYVQVRLY
jgi:hypothetical protein